MDLATAENIIQNCDIYPLDLVAIAEQVCRSEVAKRTEPVGEVAARDQWFDETLDTLTMLS